MFKYFHELTHRELLFLNSIEANTVIEKQQLLGDHLIPPNVFVFLKRFHWQMIGASIELNLNRFAYA